MVLPRRRLSELLTLYRLNPAARDVFVEGTSDRAILDYVLQEARPFGTAVRWIEDIELDEPQFAGPGGAKGRLISLAELARERQCLSIICLVDRNTAEPSAAEQQPQFLYTTVYPDLEFHVAKGQNIKDIVEIALAKPLPNGAFEDAVRCATRMYAIAKLAHQYFDGPRFVSVSKSVRASAEGTDFDAGGYLLRMDSNNGSGTLFQNLEHELNLMVDSFEGDPFMYLEFHTFEECLTSILRIRRYNLEYISVADWLGRLVRASIFNLKTFDDYFLKIIARVNG